MFVTMRHLDSNLKVGFATLSAAADDIRTTVKAITGILQELHTDLEGNLKYWEGGARAEYWKTKSVWDSAAGSIQTELASLAKAVDAANEVMYTTELKNQNYLEI